MDDATTTGAVPSDEDVAVVWRLQVQLARFKAQHGREPERWLMAARVARSAIAALRTMLVDDDGRAIPPEELTRLWGVVVEIVPDLPQGAVLR